ncbi:hypothetical protein B566_EDAN014467 [Ephemera danica]|nr:hypothetical protein B566_EDAN014467 [Ephemera danica]
MSYIEAINNPPPLPLDPLPKDQLEDRRLWIGNLDPRVTDPFTLAVLCANTLFFPYRYQLIKLLQKHGAVEKFDLLFHRNGPMAGQPRGYAFVTYENTANATKAMEALDGQTIGNKRIAVRLAHSVSRDELEKPKPQLSIPALAGAKEEKNASSMTKIQEIEAKLKMMEKSSESEFELNRASGSSGHRSGPLVVPGQVLHSYRQQRQQYNSTRDRPYSSSRLHRHRHRR